MKSRVKYHLKNFVNKHRTNALYPDAYCRHLDAGCPALDGQSANAFIADLLVNEKPCMVARFGSTELSAMLAVERFQESSFFDKFIESCKYRKLNLWDSPPVTNLQTFSGFFPIKKKALEGFVELMKDSINELDLLGSWVGIESRYTRHLGRLHACELRYLEPYFHEDPWSKHLAGKRVLVIHPFAKLIKRQYDQNRLHIFPGRDVLPQFSLNVIEAVQTLAGERDKRFESWFDALDWMEGEALAVDFDVAIIGCGAYGFPLAARLKKHGKKSIHLGGATQILFGIKGRRWDERPEFSLMYNDHWVRPGKLGMPARYNIVEGGCYW